ncbi:hypothetical protein QJS10_CPB19g01997 [Acorus calamus]|uniref:Nuclease associated modular domain-containing protein n=1 Tax=Acorus calamus TaxID=4465 RepID=A0AAV9CJX7_ACOCL|nr:hypothetical protein QJS10_CPB19g01997 [Acorus calamus]
MKIGFGKSKLMHIAELHSSFCNHLGAPRAHILFYGKTPSKFAFGKNDGLAVPWKESIFIQRKTNYIPKCLERQTMQPVRAIATIEQKSFIQIEDRAMHEPNILLVSDSDAQTSHNTSSEDSHGMDDRERLRRMRISKANKGNVPWNKGRKHSAGGELRKL